MSAVPRMATYTVIVEYQTTQAMASSHQNGCAGNDICANNSISQASTGRDRRGFSREPTTMARPAIRYAEMPE